jgi:hypothetical protein
MIHRIREAARAVLPPDADVLVVSKGDPALLDLSGARGLHFPQDEYGEYAGHHPAASADALLHLENMKMKGAQYLLVPSTAYWWFDYYGELARHLAQNCTRIPTPGDDCRIFALGGQAAEMRQPLDTGGSEEAQRVSQLEAFLESVLPPDARLAVVGAPELGRLSLGARVVQAVTLPRVEGRTGQRALSPRLMELVGEGVDYVVVPRSSEGPDDVQQTILGRLRLSGRLLAHREQLGWLFDVTGPGGARRRSRGQMS